MLKLVNNELHFSDKEVKIFPSYGKLISVIVSSCYICAPLRPHGVSPCSLLLNYHVSVDKQMTLSLESFTSQVTKGCTR